LGPFSHYSNFVIVSKSQKSTKAAALGALVVMTPLLWYQMFLPQNLPNFENDPPFLQFSLKLFDFFW
jgi:hypothetical protein